MALAASVSWAVHLLVAAAWSGSVFFVTYAVLPLARDGTIDPDPLASVAGRLRTVTRASAVLLLVTGGYQVTAAGYTGASLTGTIRGHLVLGMVVLWLVLAGLVEVAAGRIVDGTDERKVRTPGENARPFLLSASVVAALALVDAGILAAPGVV